MRMRSTVIGLVVLLLGVSGPASASHVVPGVSIPNIHEPDFQALFPNPPIAALGQLLMGQDCLDSSDTLYCTSGTVGRLQSAVYSGGAGTAADGLFAYVYQLDCTGGLVDRSKAHIPLSGAGIAPLFGADFVYIATAFDDPQPTPPVPTIPFSGNLDVFNLSEFGEIGGTTGDGWTDATRVVPPDELLADSGVPIFWSGSLVLFVTDRAPVVSHVQMEVPVGEGFISGSDLVVALVPEGAPPVTPNPNEWVIDLQLLPETATLSVGDTHTVTATATRLSLPPEPAAGVTIGFTVFGANFAFGAGIADAAGQALFDYVGSFPGLDTILGFADLNNNGFPDSSEAVDLVTATWIQPVLYLGRAAALLADSTAIGPDTGDISTTATGDDGGSAASQGAAGVEVRILSAMNHRRAIGPFGGPDPMSASISGVSDLVIDALLVTIEAESVGALSASMCLAPAVGISHLEGVRIDGIPVSSADPDPNTTLLAGPVTVVANQQTVVGGQLEVRALHVTGPGIDITVGYARSGIENCGPPMGGGSGWPGLLAGSRPPADPFV